MGVHWKIQLLGGFTKNHYIGGNCLTEGVGFGQFPDLRGGGSFTKKRGMFLRRGWYPTLNCTLCNCQSSLISVNCICNLTRHFVSIFETLFLSYHYFESTYIPLLNFSYIFVFLFCHEDIEINPGLRKLQKNPLSLSWEC